MAVLEKDVHSFVRQLTLHQRSDGGRGENLYEKNSTAGGFSVLYRAAYYNSQNGETEQANENEAECIVAKNRHGETSVIRLGWDGAHTRFSNLDEIHEQY